MERRTRHRTWLARLLVLPFAVWLASACGYHGREAGPPPGRGSHRPTQARRRTAERGVAPATFDAGFFSPCSFLWVIEAHGWAHRKGPLRRRDVHGNEAEDRLNRRALEPISEEP